MMLNIRGPKLIVTEVTLLFVGYYVLLLTHSIKEAQRRQKPVRFSRRPRFGKEPRRLSMKWSIGILCTLYLDVFIALANYISSGSTVAKPVIVSYILLILFWTIVIVNLNDSSKLSRQASSFFSAYRVHLLYAWFVGLVFEFIYLSRSRKFYDYYNGLLYATRFLRVLLYLTGLIVYIAKRRHVHQESIITEEEDVGIEENLESRTRLKPDKSSSLFTYLLSFRIFLPMLWPSKNFLLQVHFVACILLLLAGRWFNVLAPRQLGIITDKLSENLGAIPWVEIILYVFYRFCQGNMGLLGSLRSYLWIPVSQYTYKSLSTRALAHVLNLSLDFHLNKKGGEVLAALSRGGSVNTFTEQVVFQITPVMFDMVIAMVYFLLQFDIYFSIIVLIMTLLYCYTTVKITAWRTRARREMVNSWRESYAVQNDSIMNYETVKHFDADDYENNRYESAVDDYLRHEWRVSSSLSVINIVQGSILTLGLTATSILSAYRIIYGTDKVGDFVVLLTYMIQLQGPLNFFGTYYRAIQNSLIDAERLLELFNEKPTIQDSPDCKELQVSNGKVEFSNVSFAYDARKPVLKNVEESQPIMRLILRFYDVQSGQILIDDQDIRDVSLSSLRSSIGVVPQDTTLFNDTIMYNIRYAKPDATDDEVRKAAEAAQIHDNIIKFPEGYKTRVGERGLKLSGGEKQRIAVARTLLKNPPIILLDEATSALDTATERQVQASLSHLAKGRTVLVIAHRLSTITSADQILCIANGSIVEQGTHDELLKKENGMYKNMWFQQVASEKADNN
ncbi:ATP-binding cassette-type vacuolar membrane transporter Hmt1 [Schizosaccharomyces japonicus yFS275]|uniref:ATP-binding cassette-type vacuolar membrane transporter Hmt1 n=1 Tax=Schizosaccharomyces japonicus (strain yFS275 / FY16936) TaxID=402676 RepID=B6K4E1_SCHJY|nr:ATP-binding cassette-type vacuolar membrane transporter Hmt1 [Schizosaccharomyces japonicus yFS275]EEB08348.2 ATP-binding cassette-type vacuolar membrane transporter Hmt1 [Schizosaccharomyces japonicus yFS275]